MLCTQLNTTEVAKRDYMLKNVKDEKTGQLEGRA